MLLLLMVAVVVVVVMAVLCEGGVVVPRDGMMRGAAGARRMFAVGAGFWVSHSVVAGDMLCLARRLCTGWNAEW